MPASLSFDHYEVLQRDDGSPIELGRGAMGITYKAFDTNLRTPVALKVINTGNLDGDTAREQFVREARAAALLRHRNVASVFHLGMTGAAYFYAMEFIDGETVEAIIRKNGPLPALVAVRMAIQVARALNAAEQHGLVHRDIKPSNLMLRREDDEVCVKVIDFGLAHCSAQDGEEASAATAAMGGFVGTPQFASPEQLSGNAIDHRSDFYSLGATLWYMLTGRAPFEGTMEEVIEQQLHSLPPLDALGETPAPVRELLLGLLAKDPAERPSKANDLRRVLEECAEQLAGGSIALSARATREEDELALSGETSARGAGYATPGTVLNGRYEVLESLGDSSLGTQFHVRDSETGKEERVVLLHPGLDRSLGSKDLPQFGGDGESPQQNVLALLGADLIENTPALLFEWTNGFTLLELLRSRRDLRATEVLALLRQMAAGHDAITSRGVEGFRASLQTTHIHFPSGINKAEGLVSPTESWPEYVVKLNPITPHASDGTSSAAPGAQTIVGSAALAGSSDPHTPQAAVRELAWIVYEMLGGAAPLGANFAQGTRYVPLATLTEAGNQKLQQAIDPTRGYASAAEFYAALRDAAQLESTRREPKGASPGQTASFSKAATAHTPGASPVPAGSGWGKIAGIAAVLALLAGGGAWWKLHQPAEPSKPAAEPLAQTSSTGQTASTEAEPKEEPVESTPPPKEPTKEDALKAAVLEAERTQEQGDALKTTAAWLAVLKDYPFAETGRIRLELFLDEHRERMGKLDGYKLSPWPALLKEAADAKVVSAMLLLGDIDLEPDPKAALEWYTKAAERGRPTAWTQLGLMYSNGAGTERNLEKAVECFEKAADKGDAAAKFALGECYLYGKGVPKDEHRAIELLDAAAKRSDLRAMSRLGDCYRKGIGVEKDFDQAFQLFSRAADRGYGEAIGNLGVLYINGEGVPKNPEKAVETFQRGVELGDGYCMFLLARCLENGLGIAQDAKLAKEWYLNPKTVDWCAKNHVPNPATVKPK